jgi:hypothetical protein
MKKISLFLIFMIFAKFSFAEPSAFEAPKTQNEFKELAKIEQAANAGNLTLDELKNTNQELFENVDINTSTTVTPFRGNSDLPLNIPAIVWGFCCGCCGVALIYFKTDKDKDQVKKAIIGCLIGVAVSVVYNLITGGLTDAYNKF